MPELPEVETVRRGLTPVLESAVIARAEVRRPDLRWPFPENMADRLTGAQVTALRRRSKYVLADLSTGETLIIHLGMSGRMLVDDGTPGAFHHDASILPQHNHVVLHTAAGGSVTFNDARRFGAMDLWPTDQLDQHWLLEKLGPEPLGNGFHEAYFTAALATKGSPIKAVLLDQRVVAGLGNIYVCEALHRAGINPKRQAKRIATPRAAALVPVIRDVLAEAIAAGGSSLQDHRQTDGELGYFQHSFRAYDREGQPCQQIDCGGTIRRIVQSGRSTFYCAQCQR